MKPHSEFSGALRRLLDHIDADLRKGGYDGEAIRMYLAGGMAVYFHCGSRFTHDVDAIFTKRFHVSEIVIDYKLSNGTPAWLTLDQNYNPNFGLIHDDYAKASVEWAGIGNERRLVQLYVLSPLDLAVTKISRFSPQDRSDILALANRGYFTAEQLRARAKEAMAYFIGNLATLNSSIEIICTRISEVQAYRVDEKTHPPEDGRSPGPRV